MRVLRVYHAGRDAAHRERDRALARAGIELTLLVPQRWPGPDELHPEPFEVATLAVRRPGDVNRHAYVDTAALRRLIDRVRPELLDLHEEPFSRVTRQVLASIPAEVPGVAYTAQNIDKRWPPPFHQWEQAALARLAGAYPCSRQAASVLRGRGYAGPISVLPLGVDRRVFAPGERTDRGLTLGFVGRLVAEKGVLDALEVLARLRASRPARLVIVGEGPAEAQLRQRAAELGVAAAVDIHPWCSPAQLARHYRAMQALLVPSRTTRTWVEQFGRVVTEARACGTAVVAYATGALPEVVGDPAGLVAEGDVGGMAAAVLRLLGSGAGSKTGDSGEVSDWDEVAHGQLELYRRALFTTRPVPTGRSAAAAEFGPPALLPGGSRPFALPLLRADNFATRALGRVADRR